MGSHNASHCSYQVPESSHARLIERHDERPVHMMHVEKHEIILQAYGLEGNNFYNSALSRKNTNDACSAELTWFFVVKICLYTLDF